MLCCVVLCCVVLCCVVLCCGRVCRGIVLCGIVLCGAVRCVVFCIVSLYGGFSYCAVSFFSSCFVQAILQRVCVLFF